MHKLSTITLADIDVGFDFTSDCPYWDGFWEKDEMGHIGCDPDIKSPNLRKYHQALWSKPIPNGDSLELEFGTSYDYLKDRNGMRFASDSITTGFRYAKTSELIHEVMKHIDWRSFIEKYNRATYTIGGTIIFPKHKNSMNGQRGMNPYICDRWDLTLECIRRYFNGIKNSVDNPLGWVLELDKDFYEMFVDFKGYVDFFFLQDCVSDDYSQVKFLIPTEIFTKYPYPKDVNEYMEWISRSESFVMNRNRRIQDYIQQNM